MTTWRTAGSGFAVRLVSTLFVVWLVVGFVAAAQRHYFTHAPANCAKTATIAVTILAGPLNYVGVDPKMSCRVPQPSK